MLFLIALNLSFQWPVDGGRITSVFGESRADHFHDGVDMVPPDGKIYPLDEGELVYLWDRSMFPLDAYPGGGNYRVLKHGGDIYPCTSTFRRALVPRGVRERGPSGHNRKYRAVVWNSPAFFGAQPRREGVP